MVPGRLELQVGYLHDHPEVGCVLGRQELLIEPGAELPGWALSSTGSTKGRAELFGNGEVLAISTVTRRTVFDRIGGFDPALRVGEDVDWLFRLREACIPLTVLDDIVTIRRLHGDNLTQDNAAFNRGRNAVLKARLDRRRAQA
jgi:hypothetical protein